MGGNRNDAEMKELSAARAEDARMLANTSAWTFNDNIDLASRGLNAMYFLAGFACLFSIVVNRAAVAQWTVDRDHEGLIPSATKLPLLPP